MKKILKKAFIITTTIALLFATSISSISCSTTSNKNTNQTALVMDSEVTSGRLQNGMSFIIKENSIPANRISFRLVVKAGSLNEKDNQKGLSHFIEHLAFNGTKNFEKNEIIHYFEKIGMQFGAGLNAYTSFEETVYNLEIPADDPEILKTALAIIHDWACAISFEEEEIEKERKVIVEEWRSRSLGLQGRISDNILPFIMEDSLYKDRMPIGDMQIINNVSREEILSFYNTWYRPDLMTIIAVGDIDAELLESQIKENFSKIPENKEKITYPNNKIPLKTDKKFCIMKDPEQPYPLVNIFSRNTNYHPTTTEEDVKNNLISNIAATILHLRFSEISNLPDAPWLSAGIGETQYNNNDSFYYLGFVPKEGKFIDAFKASLDQLDKIKTFGVTEDELARTKELILSSAEQQLINKDKELSNVYISQYLSYTLGGHIPPSTPDFVRIVKEKLPQITIQDINYFLENILIDYGSHFFAVIPEGYPDLPTEEELHTIWTEHKNTQLSAYQEEELFTSFMEKPEKKGKILSTKEIKELDLQETILENGIKILTKKTDFEKNKLYMHAYSKGGHYYLDDKDYPSYCYATDYMITSGINGHTYNQIIKFISSKSNFNINLGINKTNEYFQATIQNQESELLLQFINCAFTKTSFDPKMWTILMENAKVLAQSYYNSPQNVFSNQINQILYKDSIRHVAFDENFISQMNPQSAQAIYKDRFANPADFTFVFVGDFDQDKLLELCQYYLGSMETSPEREELLYKYWDFPEGINTATVKKGKDKQGAVEIIFGGQLPPESDLEKNYKEKQEISQMINFLDIKLREIIREDKGGSYGINVNGYIDGSPERFYKVFINFQCQPERCQELTDEILLLIQDIQKNGVDQLYAQKLQETYLRNREVNLFENQWWLSRIINSLVTESEPLWLVSDAQKVADWISPESLQGACQKYLDTNNYVSVFLNPEE